jgi:hypothetical protein
MSNLVNNTRTTETHKVSDTDHYLVLSHQNVMSYGALQQRYGCLDVDHPINHALHSNSILLLKRIISATAAWSRQSKQFGIFN